MWTVYPTGFAIEASINRLRHLKASRPVHRRMGSRRKSFLKQIEEIFIKDIQLSKDLQDSLSSAAKERRLAESKIISARADV